MSDRKLIIDRVDNFGPKPTTPHEALVQAHAFLREEGQWITGSMFQDGDPQEAYEKSACGSWSACSMGALGLVTGEMPIYVERDYSGHYYFLGSDIIFSEETTPLSYGAAQFLALGFVQTEDTEDLDVDQLEDVVRNAILEPVNTVVETNDVDASDWGRTRVLEGFERGIALAAKGELPEWDEETLTFKE